MNKLTPEQVISSHLGDILPLGNLVYFSALIAGIRDSRKFTGRNIETGEIEIYDNNVNGCWLGAIGYLILLDQVGKCFKPSMTSINFPENTNNILRALKYFSSLSDNEIYCLYALRCALAHDYALYNINRRVPALTHHFKLRSNSVTPLIELPSYQWNGDIITRNSQNCTTVNLLKLGDLVEEIFKSLKIMSSQKQLEIILQGGSEELSSRYGFVTFAQ
ncbi:hypothetical protein [Chitinophaga sancti]|uniref:Uncharacterized protein n=1 Tax=Chitinophaga sancti TaxID=1004 RepID=A0A1K1SEE5_9BACT|nr:hypothetical protein [Chitinophaga sancti]WQD60024.1 hypothetical protein U0033_19225 [Chitinophaga sancti]WQG87846.1 hypothetical protein SR876_23240 [Chitinophaga sancti]SFW82760.1 hypothetical protein SAMN05661012_05312 [Chitinophaga sancti]